MTSSIQKKLIEVSIPLEATTRPVRRRSLSDLGIPQRYIYGGLGVRLPHVGRYYSHS
jgi:hypothetical protein